MQLKCTTRVWMEPSLDLYTGRDLPRQCVGAPAVPVPVSKTSYNPSTWPVIIAASRDPKKGKKFVGERLIEGDKRGADFNAVMKIENCSPVGTFV